MKSIINFLKKVWNWHGWIGKLCSIFVVVAFAVAVMGIPFGITKCQSKNEIIYSNTFLNETIELHASNYVVKVNEAKTVDTITILNKSNKEEALDGHYICVDLSISQNTNSKFKKHSFDTNDFKLKNHTGVYIPLSDIASLVGWDMIDYHWDQKKNGFVISSADFKTKNTVKDYHLIKDSISVGEEKDLTIYFKMDSDYCVENQIMVLEIDFRTSFFPNKTDRGEDIILLPRPDNL